MKKVLTISLLLSTILVSIPSKKENSPRIVKTYKVSQETLKNIKLQKQRFFDETFQSCLSEHGSAAATIIAKKEAQKIYNREYKRAEKLNTLSISVSQESHSKSIHNQNSLFLHKTKDNNAMFDMSLYDDDDHISPIHVQYPDFFDAIHQGIYES